MNDKLTTFADGLTHVISPIGGAEHTLCGIAFDAADSEGDESLRWTGMSRGPVTCLECGSVVLHCRGLRVKDQS